MALKRALEHLALVSGVQHLARAGRRGQVLVLAYHNIRPDDAPPFGEATLHLARERFAAQLDLLAETHDVVPVAEILEPHTGRRPRAALTFDDAYVGALTLGLDEVVSRSLPATVFVAPALLGASETWWDRLANPGTGEIDPAVRAAALDRLAGRGSEVLRAYPPFDTDAPAWARIAALELLRNAAARPGVSMAIHSWSHLNLAAVDGATLETETRRPREWMRENGLRFIDWFAFPYGRCNASAANAARDAGYTGAFRVSGGWVDTGSVRDRYTLPRYNVPAGISDAGFALRASGIGPYR